MAGFTRLLESPGFFVKFPSPGNFSGRSWKVLDFFARLWCGRQTQWCRCRCRCRSI